MLRAATAVLVLSILSGCASAPPLEVKRYSKEGASYDDYLKDRYACITEGRTQQSSGSAYGRSASMQSGEVISGDIVRACLAARGYRLDPNGFGPPEGGAIAISN